MTMTAEQPRQNAEGDPCPSWCTDHHPDAFIHRTAKTDVDFGRQNHFAYAYAGGVDFVAGRGPRVSVYGRHRDMETDVTITADLYLLPADALPLADLIEVLAEAGPEQHRQIAAAIRQAAAAIKEADQ
jgi:hypothetical protein